MLSCDLTAWIQLANATKTKHICHGNLSSPICNTRNRRLRRDVSRPCSYTTLISGTVNQDERGTMP